MVLSLYDLSLHATCQLSDDQFLRVTSDGGLYEDFITTKLALRFFNDLPENLQAECKTLLLRLLTAYGLVLDTYDDLDDPHAVLTSAAARINALLPLIPLDTSPLEAVLAASSHEQRCARERAIHIQLLIHPLFAAIRSGNFDVVRASLTSPIHLIYGGFARKLAEIHNKPDIQRLLASEMETSDYRMTMYAGRTGAYYILNRMRGYATHRGDATYWVTHFQRGLRTAKIVAAVHRGTFTYDLKTNPLLWRCHRTIWLKDLEYFALTFNDPAVRNFCAEQRRFEGIRLPVAYNVRAAIVSGDLQQLDSLFREHQTLFTKDMTSDLLNSLFDLVQFPPPLPPPQTLRWLLQLPGADLNDIRYGHEGPLLYRCIVSARNVETISLVLDHGALINTVWGGQTPLMLAIVCRAWDIVQHLIERGADIHHREEPRNETALHLAAKAGHLETVKLLVDRGANINDTTVGGETPLTLACAQRRVVNQDRIDQDRIDIALLLQDRGANVPTNLTTNLRLWRARLFIGRCLLKPFQIIFKCLAWIWNRLPTLR